MSAVFTVSNKLTILLFFACLTCLALGSSTCGQSSSAIDGIELGNEKSEKAHNLTGSLSESIQGSLGATARRFLPPQQENWRGGKISFQLKVDPKLPNYFTAKFWGGDATSENSRLMLFLDGKQIGQRHLGEVDSLDIAEDAKRFPGRFFYKTLPLPLHLTRGKRKATFTIEAQGPVWGYGDTIEKFQRAVKVESRGIYRVYSHTDPFLKPGDDEQQGKALTSIPLRTEPGPEIFEQIRERINRSIKKVLASKETASLDGTEFLANACFVPWTDAYHKKEALNKVVRSIDYHSLEFKKDSKKFTDDWRAAGPLGEAVRILARSLQPYLDHNIEGTNILRRDAWTNMFLVSRDTRAQNRRAYTNQTMIVDLNIYRCDRALEAINPELVWPKKMSDRLIHEASGAERWSGSLNEKGRPTWSKGKRYEQLTRFGLTRELGYVGGYGEIVTGLVASIYESSRATPTTAGDEVVKEQLVKIASARAPFRYPLPDKDGFKSMIVEHNVGWRDWHYPGNTIYAQSPNDDGGPLQAAWATRDPDLIAYCQQMIEDNQYFVSLNNLLTKHRGWRPLIQLMYEPTYYEWILQQPKQTKRLPMTEGQPNFVFADPDAGVVALKNGTDILYVSLYWRARYAVNFLARVHYLTPTIERDATVLVDTRFKDSGRKYKMPDQTNEPFNRRHEKFYQEEGMSLGMAGQLQPIASVPSHVKDFKPGKENIHAGKGDVYILNYGPYLIAMNCQSSKTFRLKVPEEFVGSRNVATGESFDSESYRIPAGETVVLYQEN